jgi:hypothetical protein
MGGIAVWDKLKVALVRLRDEQPGTLLGYPMPEVDEGREPPFELHLAPWATAAAGELDREFGDDVRLIVGALPYPPDRHAKEAPTPGTPAELLNQREVIAELDGPAVVKAGRTLRHGLLLRNLTERELNVATNGQVTATVVDPESGATVGGFAGAQHMPLIGFTVPPGRTERIPLLIGTASFRQQLGYTVPAGEWGVQAVLTLGRHPDWSYRRTPILPLTIVAG